MASTPHDIPRSWFARIVAIFCAATLLAAWPLSTTGQLSASQASEPVTIEYQWNRTTARPGDQRVLAVLIHIDQGWHINADKSHTGDGLIPTSVEVTEAGQGLNVGPVQLPKPSTVSVNYTGTPQSIDVYQGRAVFYIPVIVANDASPSSANLSVSVRYQTCNDRQCLIPRTVTVQSPLTIVGEPASAGGDNVDHANEGDAARHPPSNTDLFAGFDRSTFAAMQQGKTASRAVLSPGLGLSPDLQNSVQFNAFGLGASIDPSGLGGWIILLLIAAVGGFLLNLTPCVLPVIPIKIMSLSAAAGNRTRCLTLGLAMAVGVVAFWMAIGGAIAFIAGFDAINQLFQQTWFTIGVGVIIALMAVGMCGLFTVRLPRWVYAISPRHDTLPGSAGFGVMTAVLSTPCTAPFMGAAAAWAATQSPPTTLATFAAIGLGMACPYLVLSANPALIERMPRTGPAGELIKQIMGLLMLGAAAYFIGVGIASVLSEPPASPSTLYWWPVFGFIALAGAWLVWRTARITPSIVKRLTWGGVGGAAVALAIYGGINLTARGPIQWVPYTPAGFAQQIASGRVVVMDFTAQWCLNCKALEHTVLNNERVVALFDDPRVVPMKVDITSAANKAGTAKLAQVGGVGIPLLVVYAPGEPDSAGGDALSSSKDTPGKAVFKSGYYTVQEVVDAVTHAKAIGQRLTDASP